MNNEVHLPNQAGGIRILETGIRVALEEMLTGRDYARVEGILRALADSSSVPSTSKGARQQAADCGHT